MAELTEDICVNTALRCHIKKQKKKNAMIPSPVPILKHDKHKTLNVGPVFEPVTINIGTNIHKHIEDVSQKQKHDGHKNQ